ncbi:DUF805 domain-containing protein [Xenorhabdus griffiniae]|uniref:DUF805 domain-containing protein n=1 Tax=Xenorhabdus griffiniae TaxID=351672 RepID=A0ABY9XH25_9GAMM|nr:DUF805 domain-containing protein [Xenorhabdus griffiniae]MBD1227957.1 DUF805 domain-containing protein [Xenorhabdus griffiniae]MBE8588349.1 DUF805 domain-containing protein [Xenorhabdus griffiniae]WMV72239.1 DUF805 domain-containing protein [Xenorhabdus griffiniae]WNH01917.1 DUF805 domain-containing protein [Xenorhabdus griffiniae]
MNWYLSVLKNYAGFSGRARRKEYWMFSLFNMIVLLALIALASVINDIAGLALLVIYIIVTFIPNLAVTVRRLHDVNCSGWWFLLAFVPVASIILFVFTLLEGTQGDNEYGADPKRKY